MYGGYLNKFIDNGKKSLVEAGGGGIIDVVHFTKPRNERAENRTSVHFKHVARASVSTSATKNHCLAKDLPPIQFIEKYEEGVIFPHNNVINLRVKIEKDTVGRCLVDQGASRDLMYDDFYRELSLKLKDLKPTDITLIDFISEITVPLEKIVLNVTT